MRERVTALFAQSSCAARCCCCVLCVPSDISDVILTCVELRYKPDPAQAQALLAEKVNAPNNTAMPVISLPTAVAAAGHVGAVSTGPSSRPVISIPLPASVAAAASAARPRPSGGAGGRGQVRGEHPPRGAQRPHENAPASDVTERVVPTSMQQQQQPAAQSRHAATVQPSTSQPQKAAAPATRPPQQKKGYVWKPPAKSRRPIHASADSNASQKPAAPTRPASPSTPPSPFLSHMSPSSRPPSPFVQSLSPKSASKRNDAAAASSLFSTAPSRKRPHSPAASAAALALARTDSNGHSDRVLVEQMGQKMRVVSAEDVADREEDSQLGESYKGTMGKEVEESKEEQLHGVEEGGVRVILDDLHGLKSGMTAKGDKRDELAMMDDLAKFRAEMAEGGADAAAMEHDGPDGDTAEHDIRAWKRARHDERDSPVSLSHHDHAVSMATPWERETDGDGVDEAEPESEFDHSQPSSPAALDESEHRLDQFAAVKLQSGYIARHEQRLAGGEHADGMDDGEATLSGYPSKVCREPADEMAEHSLLTT